MPTVRSSASLNEAVDVQQTIVPTEAYSLLEVKFYVHKSFPSCHFECVEGTCMLAMFSLCNCCESESLTYSGSVILGTNEKKK